uniref:Uncharacterized protein n=1 Tax=Gorilla gorilla gorilla TaxID=9595 RepID=A0A2I2ZLB5_GORGO
MQSDFLSSCLSASATQIASQNFDPATVSVATAHKGAELQQELMTLMMPGDKRISACPESLIKWTPSMKQLAQCMKI